MSSSNNDIVPYIAKNPMPEGGLIKTGEEPMSQQEWDERIAIYPASYEVIINYLRNKRKGEAEIKQRAEEKILQELQMVKRGKLDESVQQ